MGNLVETYRGVVYPSQLDHMGHMNVQWYTAKFDEATWHLFSMLEITSQYIKNNKKGMAALEQLTKYKAEAMVGDLLAIKSGVVDVAEKIIRFIHVMYNVETRVEIATSELTGIHMDREIRKSCRLPAHVINKCKYLIERQEE